MCQAEEARKFRPPHSVHSGQGREHIWVLGRRHLGWVDGKEKGKSWAFVKTVLFPVFTLSLQRAG